MKKLKHVKSFNEMRTYNFNEIENRHGQRIYYFSKQPGSTELEKCINFINKMNVKYTIFKAVDKNSNRPIDIVVSGDNSFEVFNYLGEKVGECNNESYNKIKSISDILEDLEDLGFSI